MKPGRVFALLVLFMVMLICTAAQAEVSTALTTKKTYNNHKKVIRQEYVDEVGHLAVAEDKGYAVVVNDYLGQYLMGVAYYDAEGNLTNCLDGYAKRFYKRGGKYKVTESWYEDAEGKPVNGPAGWARMENTYYRTSTLTRTVYYDASGALMRSDSLHAVYEADIKLYGTSQKAYITEERYLDADGNLAAGPKGWARAVYDRLDDATCWQKTYYGPDGNMMVCREDGYARYTKVWDSRIQHFTSLAYYGADGQLMPGPNGWAYVEYDYKNHNPYTRREMYFDKNGNPYRMAKGYYGYSFTYGAKKRIIATYYYDAAGNRTMISSGYSGWTKQFTRWGLLGSQTYVDEHDKPVTVPSLGYAKVNNEYNYKTKVRTEYFSANGKPVNIPDGYSKIIYQLDDKRRVTAVSYYQADGGLKMIKSGYARATFTLNSAGQRVVTKYFDTKGKPVVAVNGADEVRHTWANGKKASDALWVNGTAVIGANGYHRVEYTYTSDGKDLSTTYLDLEGNRVMSSAGYAVEEKEYDSNGNVVATRHYDAEGNLVATGKNAYAYAYTEYAPDGMSYDVSFVGVDGNPTSNGAYWIHRYYLDKE